MELDIHNLAASFKRGTTKSIDNCTVLDIGTGAFPRYIEVRVPGSDGARKTAVWDGDLNLAVDDLVLCHEYSGNTSLRIMGSGGNDSGAGKRRVSELWESDFGAVALETDADGNVGINTSGPDAKLDVLDTAGPQLRLTHTDGSKFVDFTLDTNHDLTITPSSIGQVIFQPTTDSTDFLQILDADGGNPVLNVDSINESITVGTATSTYVQAGTTVTGQFLVETPDIAGVQSFVFGRSSDTRQPTSAFKRSRSGETAVQTGDSLGQLLFSGHDGTDYNQSSSIRGQIDGAVSANTVPGRIIFLTTATNMPTQRMRIDSVGNVKLGLGTASTQLDIGAGAMEMDEMTAPGAGAVNTARLYAVDNGAGKTQLAVVFNTGAVQILATQP